MYFKVWHQVAVKISDMTPFKDHHTKRHRSGRSIENRIETIHKAQRGHTLKYTPPYCERICFIRAF
jgi:hypothetical protein